jgi:hypothetical protein
MMLVAAIIAAVLNGALAILWYSPALFGAAWRRGMVQNPIAGAGQDRGRGAVGRGFLGEFFVAVAFGFLSTLFGFSWWIILFLLVAVKPWWGGEYTAEMALISLVYRAVALGVSFGVFMELSVL